MPNKDKNKEKKRQDDYNHRRIVAVRKAVFDYYGNKCKCCGETNPLFLTMDHINNDGHKDKEKNGDRRNGWVLYRNIILNNFPNTFQTLCYNCNCGRAKNKGICPHIAKKQKLHLT